MNEHDLATRLKLAADRADLRPAPRGGELRAAHRRRTVRRHAAVGAAAAAVLAAVAVPVIAGTGPGRSTTVAPDPGVAGTTSAATDAPPPEPCVDLELDSAGWDTPGRAVVEPVVVLANGGPSSCTLAPGPGFAVLTGGGAEVTVDVAADVRPLALAPGELAGLFVAWSNWCGEPFRAGLVFRVGDRLVRTGPFQRPPTCADGSRPPSVVLTRLFPTSDAGPDPTAPATPGG